MTRVSTFFVCLFFVFLVSGCRDFSSVQTTGSCGYQDYRCMARADAVSAGIDPDLFERQINQESGFSLYSLSSKGAIGIAQITPDTAAGWNVDPHDPVASLKAAADHMAWYYQNYGYDYGKALACYNAGCSTLVWAEQNCRNYYYCLPAETRNYITKIID